MMGVCLRQHDRPRAFPLGAGVPLAPPFRHADRAAMAGNGACNRLKTVQTRRLDLNRNRNRNRYSDEGGESMGATYVTVRITNPAKPGQFWEDLFLVDTGATDSLVPRPQLEAIDLVPKGSRVYERAGGSDLVLDITTADIEFMGEIVGGTIIFGDAGAEPLLGVTALESVGIEVDPRNQRLKRLPTVRLKELAIRQ